MRYLVIIAALAVFVAGCAEEKKTDTGKSRVALIMKSLANEFFKTMEDGAREHQKQHSGEYDLICNGIKDELDVAKQTDLVEQMIAQRVDAIVIAPADSKALVGVLKRARDAGITVVNIDNKLDSGALADKGVKIPFVGPNNRKGARLAGEVLAAELRPGDAVAIVEGPPNAFNAIQRRLGFEDAMKGMKIVASQSGDWEMAKANEVASGMITEHPEIRAILCANDSMALGAVAAVKAAGKSGSIMIVGFDNISAVHQLVNNGGILATVDQHADQIAVNGIEYALEMLKTKATPADRETPVDLITAETMRE